MNDSPKMIRFKAAMATTLFQMGRRSSPGEALRLVNNYFEVMQEDTPQRYLDTVADIDAGHNEEAHIYAALKILVAA